MTLLFVDISMKTFMGAIPVFYLPSPQQYLSVQTEDPVRKMEILNWIAASDLRVLLAMTSKNIWLRRGGAVRKWIELLNWIAASDLRVLLVMTVG